MNQKRDGSKKVMNNPPKYQPPRLDGGVLLLLPIFKVRVSQGLQSVCQESVTKGPVKWPKQPVSANTLNSFQAIRAPDKTRKNVVL
jgi:hypothetical protein